jgi:regulator of RNase E activity RraA
MFNALPADQFKALAALDTCTVANAIERFEVRMRNDGFTCGDIRCLNPRPVPTMLGYAVTVRIRCANPPMEGHSYIERTDWWNYVAGIPAPRVVVIQDLDERPGVGAFLGEVHAAILQALGCLGVVTNGAVRDVPAIERTGFQLFARSLAVSHAYVHIVDFGSEVNVGGLAVKPGDLLHGDAHGVLSIPAEIAGRIPAEAARIMERERHVLELCRSRDFSLEKLRAAAKGVFD